MLKVSETDETRVERLWALAAAADQLVPPISELAADWTVIAKGWHSLNVPIELICVAELAQTVCSDANTLDELQVKGDEQEWIATLVDVVGECWSNRAGVDLSALAGMLPNQNRRLRDSSELKRDGGVSGALKDICAEMQYDIRHHLLLDGFDEIGSRLKLAFIASALANAIPAVVDEEEVIATAIEHLNTKLPESERCDTLPLRTRQATVRILAHLWEAKAQAAASVARQVPLVASSHRAVRWSPDRLFMAPVRVWPESAQPFADAYPPDRVLADLYAGSETDKIPNISNALVEWGIAHADVVIESTVDLQKRRLAEICPADNTSGIVVPEVRLSQIALLQPEVLNRCQEGIEEATALLGLVLCCVASHDPEWKQLRAVKGRRSREDVDVSIQGALWLADLKVRAWVPVPGEDDRPQKMVANAATLKTLLDPSWLQDNDDAIKLLSEWFGFDQLELRLMGIAQDDEDRQELRDSLAKLVETGGADPDFYTDLAMEVELRQQRRSDVDRCRKLGLAVQDAIGAALKRRKLNVKLVDKGFDYEVAIQSEDALHDTGILYQLGPYLS